LLLPEQVALEQQVLSLVLQYPMQVAAAVLFLTQQAQQVLPVAAQEITQTQHIKLELTQQ
jgi:homoserine trans-succinylase